MSLFTYSVEERGEHVLTLLRTDYRGDDEGLRLYLETLDDAMLRDMLLDMGSMFAVVFNDLSPSMKRKWMDRLSLIR